MKKSVSPEEELLGSAMALPSTERESYLQRACAGNADLYAQIRTLMGAFDSAAQFVKERSTQWQAQSTGDQIDDYRLLEIIGEGGGGIVYLAEQIAPVKREVALKIIRLGMDTKEVVARFQAERQALALMDHPNIAKVFDAGATPTGRPYFVMELVRGIRITDYCNQTRMSIPERLALFIQVCQAIQHAHHRGIVHRDIKPSNVLVTLHDGVPVAKVIDFGIVKAIQGRLTEQTLHTAVELFVGTPAYVSPEQTELGGGNVDTRSDIYSLGVLLYELLTGCTPFDSEELMGAGLDAMRQRIREEEPPSPSKRLRTLTDEVITATSARYQATAAKLVQQIHGDLDWVVMRCLEKESGRRYQTAHDLKLDLQRYLNNEPVIARPPSVVYTFNKFARRHRVVFATGTALIAVLLIATLVSTWQAVRAMRAEKLANDISDFFRNDLLAQASPRNELDRDIKLRTVLDRASEKITGRFVDQPLTEASVRETLGQTYSELGEYDTARQHLESALAIYERLLGSEDPRALKMMGSLIPVLRRQGNYEGAERLGTKALQLHRRLLGSAHPSTMDVMHDLAQVYRNQGKYSAAIALLIETLDLQRQVHGAEHPETLNIMHGLALVYTVQGKLADAEPLLVQALDLHKRVFGPEDLKTLPILHNLAMLYGRQGRFAEAEAIETQVLEVSRRVQGAEHPSTLSTAVNLASTYASLGKFTDAEALLIPTLEIGRRVWGERHPDILFPRNNLALIHRERGKLDEAEALQTETVDISRQALGPEHPNTLWFAMNLALIYQRQLRHAEASALLAKGLEILQRVAGPEHPYTLKHLDNLGSVLMSQGKIIEAEPLLRSAVAGYEKSAAGGWQLFSAQSRLGEALVRLHRFAAAEPLLVDGYLGLRQRAGTIPAAEKTNIEAAGARITELYRAWDKPEKMREWQGRLAQPNPAQ